MAKRIETGTGRVEFIKHREEIFKLLNEGYTIMMVYEILKEKYKITQAYPTFTMHLRNDKLKTEAENKATNKPKLGLNRPQRNDDRVFRRTELSREEKF